MADDDKVRFKVAAPYVTLRHTDDRGVQVITGFYAGASVPPTADEADVQRLLGKDMLVAVDDPIADIVAVPAGTPLPGEPPNVPVEEVPRTSHEERMARAREQVKGARSGRAGGDDAGRVAARGDQPAKTGDAKPVDVPEPPAVNAPKAEWVEYAVAKGDNRATAEGMSKEQLVGKYGKR